MPNMPEEFVTPVRPPFDGLPTPTTAPLIYELSQTPRELSGDVFSGTDTDNTNKHFKGQFKNEIVHCFCRKHWVVLIPHFIGFLVLIAVIAGFFAFVSPTEMSGIFSSFTYRIIALVILAGFTFYFYRFFNFIFNYYLRVYIITNFRVVDLEKTLFFTDNRDSIDIREIQDIIVNQKGIFQTILGYGSIVITLSSAHATKILRCIPNPEYHFRKINKTKREYITSRRTTKIIAPLPPAV